MNDALKFLANLLGIKADEIESVNTETLTKAWNTKQKDIADNAHKSGQGQAFKAIRTSLLAIGVKTDENSDAEQIATAIKEHKVETSEITDDMVRSHKLFTKLKTDYDTVKSELENEKTESKRKESIRIISDKVKSTISDKFKVPKNSDAAQKRLDLLVNDLSKVTEKNGSYYLDGKLFEDENHQPLKYEDIVSQFASNYYDELEQPLEDDNDSPPNDKSKKVQNPANLTPKSDEELNEILKNESFTEEQKTQAFNFFRQKTK